MVEGGGAYIVEPPAGSGPGLPAVGLRGAYDHSMSTTGILAGALFAVIALLGAALFTLLSELRSLGRELRGGIAAVRDQLQTLHVDVAEIGTRLDAHLQEHA